MLTSCATVLAEVLAVVMIVVIGGKVLAIAHTFIGAAALIALITATWKAARQAERMLVRRSWPGRVAKAASLGIFLSTPPALVLGLIVGAAAGAGLGADFVGKPAAYVGMVIGFALVAGCIVFGTALAATTIGRHLDE